jgi:hypothetical protein
MMFKDGSKGQDVEKLAAYLHIKSLLSLKEVDCVIIMGFFFSFFLILVFFLKQSFIDIERISPFLS